MFMLYTIPQLRRTNLEHAAEEEEGEKLDDIKFFRYVPACCGERALINNGESAYRARHISCLRNPAPP